MDVSSCLRISRLLEYATGQSREAKTGNDSSATANHLTPNCAVGVGVAGDRTSKTKTKSTSRKSSSISFAYLLVTI